MCEPEISVSFGRYAGSALAFIVVTSWLMASCTTGDVLLQPMSSPDVQIRWLDVSGFRQLVMEKQASSNVDELRVYFAGDGEPWIAGRYPARNPSTTDELAIRLFDIDSSVYSEQSDASDAVIFLGRPCFHSPTVEAECSLELWTTSRYSEVVVEAMTTSLQSIIATLAPRQVILIGYSGGGTLALLTASRLNGQVAVVTIASNLDTHAWTSHHQYLPLHGSLNPADDPKRYASIDQFHLQGGRDTQVPPPTTSRYLQALSSDAYNVFDEYDHRCCWDLVWPTVLRTPPWQYPPQVFLKTLRTQDSATR